MRDLFARWAAPSDGYPDAFGRGNRKTSNELNDVTPVTSVTPENGSQQHAPDDADRMDTYEERAAILEYEGHLSRSKAERRAWLEVFGSHIR